MIRGLIVSLCLATAGALPVVAFFTFDIPGSLLALAGTGALGVCAELTCRAETLGAIKGATKAKLCPHCPLHPTSDGSEPSHVASNC